MRVYMYKDGTNRLIRLTLLEGKSACGRDKEIELLYPFQGEDQKIKRP